MQSSLRLRRQQRILSNLSCCCSCQASASNPSYPLFLTYSSKPSPRWRSGFEGVRRNYSSSRSTAQSASATTSTFPPHFPHASSTGFGVTAAKPLESFFRRSFLGKHETAADDGNPASKAHTQTQQDYVESLNRDSQRTGRAVLDVIPQMATPTSAWKPVTRPKSLKSLLTLYKQLAKGRLSAWVVLTAMTGYAMCPTDPATAALAMEALVQDTFGTAVISDALSTAQQSSLNNFALTTLLATTLGTALCSMSANTFNQLIEMPYDAQMPRTAKRPLPSGAITPLHALTVGTVSGVVGCATLYTCVNPLVASLGLLNIVLYAAVYTPLKRLSVTNTWIGALVGGIPPLMGWAACTNSLDPFSGQAGAWVLALILFAWQFPHFNSLSWTIRSEYARGGYRMLSAVNPGMNARVSLRWTVIGALAAGVAAPLVGLTSWTVGILSLVPSSALGFYAYRFWQAGTRSSLARAKQFGIMKTIPGARATDKDPRDAAARSLFYVSLVHLPALLFMMMAGKFGFDWWASRTPEEEAEEQKLV